MSPADGNGGDVGRSCSRCAGRLAGDNRGSICAPCLTSSRGELPDAPHVPPEFWQYDDLRQALAARHMGQIIRAYRQHPWHRGRGLRQEEVAGWAGIQQPQLSKIERGPGIGHLDKLVFWARLLRIPQRCLWFALPEDDAVQAGAADSGRDDDVDRREFLGAASALAAGTVLSGDPSRRALGLAGGSELDRVRPAIARAARLERASQYAALGAVLPGLTAETEELLDGGLGDQASSDLVVLLSKVYALKAWLLIKRDEPAGAKTAASSALESAQQADDAVLVGAAMRCLAETYLRAERYGLACDLAVEAAESVKRAKTSGSDALAVQGAGYLSAAMACARDGQDDGAGELLAAANACARQVGGDVSTPVVFGPSNVDIHRVAVAIDLGDSVTALRQAEGTTVRLPAGFEERQARYLIDVARAYGDRQRDNDAVQVLLEAEAVAPEEVRTHRLTRTVLVSLLSRERRSRAPALRPLAERCGAIA